MRVAVYISSVTGNTRKIAESAAEALRRAGNSVTVFDSASVTDPREADVHIIAFWCRRQTMDPASLRVARACLGLPTLAIGTMGSIPESPYGQGVMDNVLALTDHAFICRGRIDPARTEARRALPPGAPHYLSDESYARHLSSRSHPDERDIAATVEFVLKHINEYR